jgi:hypothetical protein
LDWVQGVELALGLRLADYVLQDRLDELDVGIDYLAGELFHYYVGVLDLRFEDLLRLLLLLLLWVQI